MRVLFLCPHGAAKSAVAAAMLANRAELEDRTDVAVRNAGTDPDDVINPLAVQLLESIGLRLPDVPHLVTSEDVDWADVVVSLGCARENLPRDPVRWEDWSDAPGVTEDARALMDLVEERMAILLR